MKRFVLFFIFTLSVASAKDFGIVGRVIPIKENNIIDVIRERAEAVADSEKDALQKKIRSHYEKKLRNPKPIDIAETRVYTIHYFDPTISVTEEIKDYEGKTIIEKGTKHNPLITSRFNNDLLIFNGDDAEQVEWAKSHSGVWILVKGKPLELEELEKRPVFFDQQGILCKKFKVKSVLTKISQHELLLKVESIPKGDRL